MKLAQGSLREEFCSGLSESLGPSSGHRVGSAIPAHHAVLPRLAGPSPRSPRHVTDDCACHP